jgi:outer membrane lipoprotein-sorting protein
MGKDDSQQRFAEAKKLYAEGKFEKALSCLQAIAKHHPDVFNIQLPMIQCLQHLKRVEDVKLLHGQMQGIFTEEKHKIKLAKVERWIKRQEKKAATGETLSKDGQIDSEIEDQIAERMEDGGEGQNGALGDADAKDAELTKVPANGKGMHSTALRRCLIALEVVFIVCVGSSVMYLLITQTARELPEFSADIVMKVNDSEMTGKLFLKNANTFRMEIMEQTFISNDGQVRKMLTEEEKYININPADVERYNPLVGLSNFGKWVHLNNAKKVGHEKLQGYACDIYEATVAATDASPSMSTRVWYCRQIKFPLKSENTAPELNGSVSVTLNNIRTEEALPEKLFTLPDTYAEYVKEKKKEPDPDKLEGLVDNMERMLEFGDPTALLEQFQ